MTPHRNLRHRPVVVVRSPFTLAAALLCTLAGLACDGASAGKTETKASDGKAADAKAGGGKAAAPKDDKTLLDEAKAAAMAGCSLPPADFTDAKMGSSDVLAGNLLHVWSSAGPTPRESRSFVKTKAMVRAMTGDQVELYITTDGSDPCALPRPNKVNLASGPVAISKDGNEVVSVTISDKKPGKYFGRTLQETMADMMGGPPNWMGIGYTVKDASVTDPKADDAKMPWATLNSEGRSHVEITAFEAGKALRGRIHACLGGDAFVIGPIDAGFCADAQEP